MSWACIRPANLDHGIRRNATEQPALTVDDRRRCDPVPAGQHHQLVLAKSPARSRRVGFHDILEPAVFLSCKQADQRNEPDQATACVEHVHMLETVEPVAEQSVDRFPDRRAG
jgi:hypothetical protein